MRQNMKRRAANLQTLEGLRKAAKVVKKHVASANKSEALKALSQAFATLDKAAKKNVIHKNNANRHKSRLTKMVSKLK